MGYKRPKSSLVAEMKVKERLDPILVEFKKAMLKKSVKAFSKGEMEYLDIKVGYVLSL